MPFWKKSEDPWDIDPAKQRRSVPVEEEEKGPGLLDQLQDWNKARKAEKAKRETPLPPMTCPWCGKEMEAGYLMGNRGVWWAPGRPDAWAKWVSPATAEGAWQVDTEGEFFTYQTAWYCPDCRKLVADVPAPSPEQMERLARTMDTRAAGEYVKTREEEN